MENLLRLYKEKFGEEAESKELSGGGSSRKYFRLESADGPTVIGVESKDIHENKTFIKLAECFRGSGINVPEIIAVSSSFEYYLEQDLGNTGLFELLDGPDKIKLTENALEQLVKLQSLPNSDWIDSTGFPPFSERLIRWDLNYFKYDFLKATDIVFDESRLEDDFDRMTAFLANIPEKMTGFMYRDFQSRNIMVNEGKLWFIDFQGGRLGPIVYDAVSFLWQARAPFSFEERHKLAEYYCQLTSKARNIDINEVREEILPFALFRTLQVLGAYGLRGLIQKKPHFLKSLSPAIYNLRYLKESGVCDPYPELSSVIDKVCKLDFTVPSLPEGLTVSVCSFSYKKGYPTDLSGNGGGFIFDCRAIHNPGRYSEYRQLTGLDDAVKEFLRKDGEADEFIEKGVEIVTPSIRRYLSRGFNSLIVGFGCTGGQHRSVYCAEGFANHIHRLFPEINVRVIHREQNKEYTII